MSAPAAAKGSRRSVARRRPARGRARGRHADRRRTGAALLVRGRHRGAGDRRRRGARRQRIVAAAHRPAAARQRRHAPRRDRIPQRALSARRRQAAARASRQDRRRSIARGDGRWVRLHTNLPHHRAGTLKLLGADYDRAAVQRAHRRLGGVQARGRRGRGRASSSPRRDRSPNGMRIRKAARWRGLPLFTHRADRRCAAATAAAGRSAARRHQGAGPDPRHRRPGVRAHARGAWRRRAATSPPRICRRWRRW